MNHARTILFPASLAVSAGLNAGAANATDHRMWREQVAPPVHSVIELKSIPADSKTKIGNDSLLWREQVLIASKNRVFVLDHASQRHAKSDDTRLWREQIQSKPPVSEVRTSSDSGRTAKVQSQ